MVDNSGGFAAVSADFLEAVGDEYNRNPKLLFSLRPPWIPPVNSHRDAVVGSLRESVSLARLSSLSNLLIPTGLQQLASSKLCCDMYRFFLWACSILFLSLYYQSIGLSVFKFISYLDCYVAFGQHVELPRRLKDILLTCGTWQVISQDIFV